MKTTVALLLYKRPEHSVRVIESLVQNGVRHCVAFMDGCDTPEVAQKQELMVEYIENHKSIDIDLIRSNERRGLAKSVVNAMNTTLEEFDGVVFLEDDCVMRPTAMRYFQDGLLNLRDRKDIRSICGYLYPVPFLTWNGNSELLLLQRFNTWGWATWRDRWQEYDENLRTLVNRLDTKGININELAGDIATLCARDCYLDGQMDIWSLNWSVLHYLTQTYAVYPRESLIVNIGFDGSGQNCVVTRDFEPLGTPFSLVNRSWEHLRYEPSNECKVKQFMDENGLKIFPSS